MTFTLAACAEMLWRCCHFNSLSFQVGMVNFDQATFAADFHAWKASSRW